MQGYFIGNLSVKQYPSLFEQFYSLLVWYVGVLTSICLCVCHGRLFFWRAVVKLFNAVIFWLPHYPVLEHYCVWRGWERRWYFGDNRERSVSILVLNCMWSLCRWAKPKKCKLEQMVGMRNVSSNRFFSVASVVAAAVIFKSLSGTEGFEQAFCLLQWLPNKANQPSCQKWEHQLLLQMDGLGFRVYLLLQGCNLEQCVHR